MESTWWNACYVVASRRWVYHSRLFLCSQGLHQSIHPPQSCVLYKTPGIPAQWTPCNLWQQKTLPSTSTWRASSSTLFHNTFALWTPNLKFSSRKSFKYSTIGSRATKRECRMIWSHKVDNPRHSNGSKSLVRSPSMEYCLEGWYWYCDLNMHIDCTHREYSSVDSLTTKQTAGTKP